MRSIDLLAGRSRRSDRRRLACFQPLPAIDRDAAACRYRLARRHPPKHRMRRLDPAATLL